MQKYYTVGMLLYFLKRTGLSVYFSFCVLQHIHDTSSYRVHTFIRKIKKDTNNLLNYYYNDWLLLLDKLSSEQIWSSLSNLSVVHLLHH